MKISSILALVSCSMIFSGVAEAQKRNLQLIGRVIAANGKEVNEGKPIIIEKIAKNQLWYRKNRDHVDITPIKIDTQQSIYIARPKDYIDAVELFESRKYDQALAAFLAIKEKYANFSDIENSLPALAGLYELDCYRKLRQYEKLAKAEKVFGKERWLTKESHKQQMQIYKLWVMLGDKQSHSAIVKEYNDKWRTLKLPNYLRAQVEFLHGKAQESLGESGEALIAYSKAMSADFAASEVLTLEALNASFNLIENDEEAQEIRKIWDRGDSDLMEPKVNTRPYMRLLEASGLARIHDKLGLSGYNSQGKMVPLPEKYRKYLKYTETEGDKFVP